MLRRYHCKAPPFYDKFSLSIINIYAIWNEIKVEVFSVAWVIFALAQFIEDFHPTHTRVKLHNITNFLFCPPSPLPLCLSVCLIYLPAALSASFFLKISIKIMYTQRAQHVPFAARTYIYLYNSNGGNSWLKVQFFPPIIFPGINTCNAMRRGDRCFFPKRERDKQKQRQPNALCAFFVVSLIETMLHRDLSIYLASSIYLIYSIELLQRAGERERECQLNIELYGKFVL